MTYAYSSMEAILEEAIDLYKKEGEPEFILMDTDSYLILRDELMGDAPFMELDFYRGCRVFRSDIGRTFIVVL